MQKAIILIDNNDSIIGNYRYIKLDELSDIRKFKKYDFNCIIVRYLRPEFAILLPRIDLIITENGGQMCHLAVMATIERKSILISDSLYGKTNKNKGLISIIKKSKGLYVTI